MDSPSVRRPQTARRGCAASILRKPSVGASRRVSPCAASEGERLNRQDGAVGSLLPPRVFPKSEGGFRLTATRDLSAERRSRQAGGGAPRGVSASLHPRPANVLERSGSIKGSDGPIRQPARFGRSLILRADNALVSLEKLDLVAIGNPRLALATRTCEPMCRPEPPALLAERQATKRAFRCQKHVGQFRRESHVPTPASDAARSKAIARPYQGRRDAIVIRA
jgi:hypothetical protein